MSRFFLPARRRLIRTATHAAVAATATLAGAGARAQPKRPADGPVRVGFLYPGTRSDFGWIRQFDLARLDLARRAGLKVSTTWREGVQEGQAAERAVRELANSGHRLIVGTTYGYQDAIIRVARDFPDFAFENAMGFKRADNVATFGVRQYEARFLAGIVAARASRTGRIGFVAAEPYADVLQSVNAFCLGARSVNPKAVVPVAWTWTWTDPQHDHDAALALVARGCDVLTHHTDTPGVLRAAEESDVDVIAGHSEGTRFAPLRLLASVVVHFDDYLAARARAVADATWTSTATWGGLSDGMVRLENVSRRVTASTQALVASTREDIIAGRRKVFGGPLRTSTGQFIAGAGDMLGTEALGRMDWLVEGVEGKLR